MGAHSDSSRKKSQYLRLMQRIISGFLFLRIDPTFCELQGRLWTQKVGLSSLWRAQFVRVRASSKLDHGTCFSITRVKYVRRIEIVRYSYDDFAPGKPSSGPSFFDFRASNSPKGDELSSGLKCSFNLPINEVFVPNGSLILKQREYQVTIQGTAPPQKESKPRRRTFFCTLLPSSVRYPCIITSHFQPVNSFSIRHCSPLRDPSQRLCPLILSVCRRL